uniref:3-oxo-5-alpha-steroid 4-dehydrogenase C-terminal domain-containing protein n=1 Tax=Anguilla anguilla TaxID=7936 RepID=A0A0E9QGN8_ANGAN
MGGLFDYVSGANSLVRSWNGWATRSLLGPFPRSPSPFFTMCSIGPRAYHHRRFYKEKSSDYPQSRKALDPFIFERTGSTL